ncbi:MAG: hypothetical protein IJ523_02760 [Succinivibrionaceae bacterium]|nr:hypothetical protein [Succinivibrionaceae bacterium]
MTGNAICLLFADGVSLFRRRNAAATDLERQNAGDKSPAADIWFRTDSAYFEDRSTYEKKY